MMIRQAVVLVGGLGTRLGDLTAQTPKPLLEVGGRPFLARLLDEVRRQGVERILLLAGFGAGMVEAAFADDPGVSVSVEPRPLGTGGALRFAEDRLDPQFFFLNGDSLFDIPLADLAPARAGDALAALALRPVKDIARYGPAVLEGGRIVSFGEGQGRGAGLVNGGVAAVSRTLVDAIPAGRAVSIEAEIWPVLAREGRLSGRAFDRPFIDIGVPEDFARAQTFLPALLDGRR